MVHKKTNIHIVGDTIYDIYQTGYYKKLPNGAKRFISDKAHQVSGGALNVSKNIHSLLAHNANVTFTVDDILYLRSTYLYRLVTDQEIIEFPMTEFTNSYSNILNGFKKKENFNNILLVSDYNKGAVSYPTEFKKKYKDLFDVILVDSKHRSLDLDILKLGKTTIWHATGEEYNWQYAQNFDWVIWTNGPKDVWFGKVSTNSNKDEWVCLSVPKDTLVKDVTGAGDTFVAACAAYLANNFTYVNSKTLSDAVTFAIECCQEVIQQQYCAVTTKKI